MPPERTAKTAYRQPDRPTHYLGKHDPSQEHMDDDDEVFSKVNKSIKADPYRLYVLKTGQYAGRTLQQLNDDKGDNNRFNYLRWLLTAEKACDGVGDGHIVRRGLLHWNNQAGYQATIPPSDEVPPCVSGRNASSLLKKWAISIPSPARFKNATGQPI